MAEHACCVSASENRSAATSFIVEFALKYRDLTILCAIALAEAAMIRTVVGRLPVCKACFPEGEMRIWESPNSDANL